MSEQIIFLCCADMCLSTIQSLFQAQSMQSRFDIFNAKNIPSDHEAMLITEAQ